MHRVCAPPPKTFPASQQTFCQLSVPGTGAFVQWQFVFKINIPFIAAVNLKL